MARVELYANGAQVGVDTVPPYEFALLLSASLGSSVEVTAVATDVVGNRGPGLSRTIAIVENTAPTVRITAPLANATVLGGHEVSVQVEASDPTTMSRVTFTANGGAAGVNSRELSPKPAATVTWLNWQVPIGLAHNSQIVLAAAAVDVLGAVGESAPVTVTYRDTAPPQVRFTSPSATASFDPGQAITVSLRVDDPSGVAALTLTCSGAFACSLSHPSPSVAAINDFSVAVPADANGSVPLHLVATATDMAGNPTPAQLDVRIADIIAPQVLSITPADGQTDTGAVQNVAVTFSEAIVLADAGAFEVREDGAGGAVVPGTVQLTSGGALLTWTPSVPMKFGAAHTVSLSDSVMDLAGTRLAPLESSFAVTSFGLSAPAAGTIVLADQSGNSASSGGQPAWPYVNSRGARRTSDPVIGTVAWDDRA